jgi:uncharacterized protein (DUF433 family)
MPRKKLVRFFGDIREYPRYSIEEAARYLRIPKSTLQAWTRGQHYHTRYGTERIYYPVIDLADQDFKLLSFYNLAEAHILRSTRDRYVPLRNVRLAIDYVRKVMAPSPHPLLTSEFKTFGKEIFIEHLGKVINATKQGQIAMRQILEEYLQRIDRDLQGMPIQVYPFYSKRLAINIKLSSGKPVVKGTGIMAEILADRRHSGESIPELADDYGLEPIEIEEAIQEFATA